MLRVNFDARDVNSSMSLLAETHAKRYLQQVMARDSTQRWLDSLPARGRATFTLADAVADLGVSEKAASMAVGRLRRRGLVASPSRGFYLVIPPEYRALGSLPAIEFVDPLLGWLGVPYYVGLLSAAALHGSAHQRPQRFQVVVPKNRRSIELGEVAVDYVARADMGRVPIETRNTRMGTVRVSTAEATALDLVGNADRCAGLDHVATVLAELAEAMRPERLAEAAKPSPIAWVQRLGWLLERVDQGELAAALDSEVGTRAHAPAPLVRSAPTAGAERSVRWRLIINAHVEPDEL